MKISFNTLFSFLAICIINLSSCQKEASFQTEDDDNNQDTIHNPITPRDSSFVLTGVRDNIGTRITFTYDSVKKRYSSWQEAYNANYYDSALIHYGADNKILSVVRKKQGDSYTPQVCEYNSSGKISKIYHKREIQTIYPQLYSDYFVQYNNVSEIEYYDSIVYNSNNRIGAVYQKYINSSSAGAYSILSYYPQADSLLQSTKRFEPSTGLTTEIFFRKYSDKANPYSTLNKNGLFPFFCTGMFTITKVITYPTYYTAHSIQRYVITNPLFCTEINNSGSNIRYTLNSDSLISICTYGGLPNEYVSFNYTKYKK